MINNTNLIKLDIYSDYIPIVSSITNIFNLFQIFFIRNCIDSANINHHYFSYIKDKSYFRVITLCIPILGNITIFLADYFERKNILNSISKGNIDPFITSSIAFKYDKKVSIAALSTNKLAWQYIGKPLQNDLDIIATISRINSKCKKLRDVSELLQKHPDILENGEIRSIKLFSGTQSKCNGSTSIEKVKSIFARLSKTQESGISFNKDKISEKIRGGTCSAMSLKFAKCYIKHRERLSDCNCENSVNANCTSLALLSSIQSLEKKFATSNEKMRTRQAAFNTIEVVKKVFPVVDYSKNKVQSLAHYYGFTIDYTSNPIDTRVITSANQLTNHIDSLPQGIFLIRGIFSANNEKLEHYGHSMVYINNDLFKVFYDPEEGARILSKKRIHEDFFAIFRNLLSKWYIDNVRFFRLAAA